MRPCVSGVRRGWSCRGILAAVLVVLLDAGGRSAAAAEEPSGDVVEFTRVRVPQGRLQDVPIGSERHVPVSAAEFDRALARLGSGLRADRPRNLPEAARYELRPDAAGGLVGRVTIEVRDAGPGRFLELGAVRSAGGSVRTARGAGAAVVFGMSGGGTGLATPEPGTYSCDIAFPVSLPDDTRLRLPLVGALTTTIVLANLPPLSRPLVAAAGCRPLVRRVEAATPRASWQIDVGPVPAVDIEIVDGERPAPRVAIWTRASVRGSSAGIATQLVPAGPWHGDEIVLVKSLDVRTLAVRIAGADETIGWRETDEGRELRIEVPAAIEGRATPLVVEAIGAVTRGREWAVPAFRVNAAGWGGGGTVVSLDPGLVVEAVDAAAAGWRLVTPEVAARWPLPATPPADDAGQTTRMHFELQRHTGEPRVVLRPRATEFDVARVTTVELTREQTVGRAACDVRVVAGEAFVIEGRIMQGWVIDSVEAVHWPSADGQEGADSPRRPVPENRVLEWAEPEVPGRPGLRTLRIALDAAASPAAGVGLRITGHRLGVPFDAAFETGDMDMVRLVGESAGMAVIDFRPAPEALVEVGGTALGLFEVAERLGPLVEESAPRGRIRGGERAASRKATLVRRRPPLDADVAIDVAVREETAAQTVRIACQATAAPIDSLVVQFSEAMGPDLGWELLSPAGGGLVARRVEATDPTAGGPRERAPGESWLVELSPAVVGRVRVRARREVPCADAVSVPLAWVEAATRPGGTVVVRGEGASRPAVRNRRLRELPPSPDAPAGTVAEFAYDDADRRTTSGPAAVEVLPPQPDAEARAWAWHEDAAVWCHDSGTTEIESRFDIENHGRDAVTLTPLPGRRLHEVLIDGRPLDLPAIDAASGGLRVSLPAGRQRFTLAIRALTEHVPRLGCWWIETSSCAIDLPVLDRRLQLLLPPDLEAVPVGRRHREVAAAPRGWRERLFALETKPGPDAAPGVERPAALAIGFRSRWFVPTTGAADAVGIGIVRRRLLDAAAIVSAWLMLVAVSFAARQSRVSCIVLCAGAAIVALWMPAPFDQVTRVAWWASIGGGFVATAGRGTSRRGVVAGMAATLACGWSVPAAAAEKPAPMRVFVMPGGNGDDLLVPERLFHRLAAAAATEDVGFRVVACRIRADVVAIDAPWTVELDVDVDPGGRIVLDQRPCGGRWLHRGPDVAAVTVGFEEQDRVARLAATAGGRLTVRLAVQPAVERRGDLDFIAACVPSAARAAVELLDVGGRVVQPAAESLHCEVSRRGEPYLRVGSADAVFDVSGAAAVRLVRPVERRDRLVSGGPRGVRTINEVAWGLDGCRMQATFEVDPGPGILRSFVVTASPPLVVRPPAAEETATKHTVIPLGPGRHLVELREPRRGVARVQVGLESPLVDPVGSFTVPEARVESAVSEVHEVRLTAAADLDVDVEPPAAAVPAGLADGDPPRSGWAWRTERGEGKPAASWARLSVRRKTQELRATQRLAVEFSADGVGLFLRAKLDASTTPLATLLVDVPRGFTLSRVAVFEDDVLDAGAADRGPLDIDWKPQAEGVAIVVQRPRAGRFRLEVDALRSRPPESRGSLPLMRALLAGGTPLTVEWRQLDDAGGGVRRSEEVPADGPAPEYELVMAPLHAVEPPAVELPDAAVPVSGDRQERVLLGRVHVALDDAGRLRGVARFDLLTGGGFVRLRLPPKTRLFDVLVDGREVQAVPEGLEAWVVRLHDSLWPRSVSVVFGAEVGSRGRAGTARLAAPTIDGLRAQKTFWTIDPPPGAAVRIEEPDRSLDTVAWQSDVRTAEARVAEAFGPVIAATPEPVRERYREFAAALAAGPSSPLEASWDDALPRSGGGGRVHGVAGTDGSLSCRIEDARDESLPTRVALTAVIVAVISLAPLLAGRQARPEAAG